MINLFKAISRFLRLILIKNISFLWRLLNLLQAAQEKILRYKRPKVDDISTVQDVERGSLQELHTNYLTVIEADQIRDQFRRADDGRRLLFWTNVPRALAQAWANANEANTLSTMMGPLMDEMNGKKKGQAWSSYVKGVSCLFAQFARQKSAVIVLTTPPGVGRYRNNSTYISLEEPILKWSADGSEKLQINYVHPTVRSAETSEYSRWPQDHSKLWIDRFGKQQRIEALALSKEVIKVLILRCTIFSANIPGIRARQVLISASIDCHRYTRRRHTTP